MTSTTFPLPARFGGGELVMRTLTTDEAKAAVLRAEVPGMREALVTGGLAAVVATLGIRRECICDAIVTLRGEAPPTDPDERKAWWGAQPLPDTVVFGACFDRLHPSGLPQGMSINPRGARITVNTELQTDDPIAFNIDPSGSAGE